MLLEHSNTLMSQAKRPARRALFGTPERTHELCSLSALGNPCMVQLCRCYCRTIRLLRTFELGSSVPGLFGLGGSYPNAVGKTGYAWWCRCHEISRVPQVYQVGCTAIFFCWSESTRSAGWQKIPRKIPPSPPLSSAVGVV